MREWAERHPRLYLLATSVLLFIVATIVTLVATQLLMWGLTPTPR